MIPFHARFMAAVAGGLALAATSAAAATPDTLARFIATIPLGRMSRPSDIAAACVYLASDDAEFVTGVVLPVDGGRTV